jgi:RNA polymerase sigma factor (sigma-70 family)
VSATANNTRPWEIDHGQLAQCIGAGDPAAEIAFVNHFQAGIRALVRRHARAGDPAVDDLTQTILQSLIEQLRRSALNNPEALPAYVRSAVVFAVRAEYRRRKLPGARGGDDAVEHLTDHDTPERATQRAQTHSLVLKLLGDLSVDRDREILRLHYLADADRDQICARLHIKSSHFHRVLFRARERMRQLLISAGVCGE